MPHTAFAMNIGYRDMKNSLSFAADDINIIKYLKGETVNIQKQDMNKGFVLVCVDSFPLGFAVYDGNKLKNLYEKGWTYK
jgi:NOL1/NOP2/fmu family ribosome biogenesis protein